MKRRRSTTAGALETDPPGEPSLLAEPPKDSDRVLAAEAEAVDHRRVDLRLALGVGHVVEVTGRVRHVVVDGGCDPAVADGADRRDRGQSAGRAEGVPDQRRRRGHRNPARLRPEWTPDRTCL